MESVTVALHTAELLGAKEGETVAIIGAGSIGLAVGQVMRLRGSRVITVEPKPRRRELARKLGLEIVLDPGE